VIYSLANRESDRGDNDIIRDLAIYNPSLNIFKHAHPPKDSGGALEGQAFLNFP
jgi:hypothetical protein